MTFYSLYNCFDVPGQTTKPYIIVDFHFSVWECVLYLLCVLQPTLRKLVRFHHFNSMYVYTALKFECWMMSTIITSYWLRYSLYQVNIIITDSFVCSLIFRKPFFSRMDVWTVFWCVGITGTLPEYICKAICWLNSFLKKFSWWF